MRFTSLLRVKILFIYACLDSIPATYLFNEYNRF